MTCDSFFSILLHAVSSIATATTVFFSCMTLGGALVNRLFSSEHCSKLHLQDKTYHFY